jgi:serine/threonine-protein kinase
MPSTANTAQARDAGGAGDRQQRAGVSPGDRIGDRYLVQEVLGAGGMGVVLAARHEALGQPVAIKIVSGSPVVHADAFARFAREARIIASLESDHVVRVVDYGMHAGVPYMVMELLAGRDLGRELATRGALPVAEAVDYVIQACEGLSAAHAKGVVHRDVKPANLFVAVRADGERVVKVLDFGVSKLHGDGQDDGQLTRTTSVLGSPMYMSPEQIRDPRAVDARADVWSLGVVLYKLLAEGAPFEGVNAAATCAAIVADPPHPLEARAPHVPVGLRAIVLRCLEKQRELRYPSVAALARDLAPFASHQGSTLAASLVLRAGQDGVLEPSHPSRRRGGLLWVVASALVAVGGVVAAGMTAAARRPSSIAVATPDPPPAASTVAPPVAEPVHDVPPSASVVVASPPSTAATPATPATSLAPSPASSARQRAWGAAARAPAARPAATPTTHFGGSALDDHH